MKPTFCTKNEQPREKFIQQGKKALTDRDLLAILLRTGIKGYSVLEIADLVLQQLPQENIYYLGEISIHDLCKIHGIGRDKAITLCAAVELGRRIVKQRVKKNSPDFNHPDCIAEYLMEDMRYLPQERFIAAFLSTKNRLICIQTISIGSLNMSVAKARDVFRMALQYNAAAVILAHNHPSGDPEPSPDDIAITKRIAEAGNIMGIPVLDHIIIGDGDFVSLCRRGYL
ncbi:DNA repair protein RadC [Megasphaera hutchinsoni]|uniref:Putative DNA repair protein RadC n=1 Tax=Megasphaera hutchinsoni TaxID=1588748 RepID=A0A134CEW5_9FIRM|nr:DNA repair protein RadC [Megasphaera hutchinsoni]KXB90644.1 putative DNA repair protein RadC [Megasphaera hutchinsoni]MUP48469.1 JAB domain-containing protein [Veillonellaceae bacterium M2-8]